MQVVTAGSLAEALQLLDEHGPEARLLAGGTDAVVEMKDQVRLPAVWIDIGRVAALKGIEATPDQMRVGALCTYSEILRASPLRERAPLLTQACAQIGSVQIRNMATLGGNLGTASPAGDTLPPLYALEAHVMLLSKRGERTVKVEDFITGVRRTVRQPDELIAAVSFAPQPPAERSLFQKLGPRGAQSIAMVNLAMRLGLNDDGSLGYARFAFGSVAPTVIRARKCESAALAAGALNEAKVRAIAQLAWKEVAPISDVRASAAYRRDMVVALMHRGLWALLGKEVGIGAD